MFKKLKTYIHYDIVRNSFNCTSLFKRWRALSTCLKPIYIMISFIICHCTMLFTRWRALHAWKNQKNMESHSTEMCMTKLQIQRIWKVICTFLCEWLSNFFWFFHVWNTLQRVNSMVQWRIINNIIMYIGFDHVCNALHGWIAWCSDELLTMS